MNKIFRIVVGASFLISGAAAITACSHDDTTIEQPQAESPTTFDSPGFVSQETALAAVYDFMDEQSGTRSAKPQIRNVETLNFGDFATTRSASVPENQPLAYIVNFKEGGYAIVGADVRHDGVVALVHKGSMDAWTLIAAKSAFDREETANAPQYMNGIVVGQLQEALETPLPEAETRFVVDLELSEGTLLEKQESMIAAEWGQFGVYNESCSQYVGLSCAVGCVPVAFGPVIIYNHQKFGVGPSVIKRSSGGGPVVYPNWLILHDAIKMTHPSIGYQSYVSLYLASLGFAMGTDFGPTISNTAHSTTIAFLKNSCGYKNVEMRSFDANYVRWQVFVKKQPIVVRGNSKSDYTANPGTADEHYVGWGSFHAWFIDGWMKREIRRSSMLPATYKSFAHCRFGYNGDTDGYYKIPTGSSNYNFEGMYYYEL